MNKTPFVIYKSSAGSGKTYTLTLEYLKLALAYPTAFRGILAVTFTNKATQEMKSRILEVLDRLRREVRPYEYLDQQLMAHLDIDATELRTRAENVLKAILHDYANFYVATIDSFFQKVVRAFAREIDLQAKFDVALDQEAVLERVVDRVVEQVLDDPYLHQWLVEYALTKIQEGKSWDIRSNIRDLGKQVFTENFKQYQQYIREFLSGAQNIEALKQYIRDREASLRLKAKGLHEEAEALRQRFGLEWTDFMRGGAGFGPKFGKLGSAKDPFPSLTGPQKEAVDDETKWYAKTSKKKEAIIGAFHAGLAAILAQFTPLREEWLSFQAINRNFYAYGVFRNILEELREIKEEENILLISDANDFLKQITRENEAPFIYEKVGNQYHHFLIDEFQDTSGFQWDSFRPLLENSLAFNHSNLLVGDVKQSIYRWRGGDMKLLLEKVEEDIGAYRTAVKNLDTNYRSLPNIIAFNNALFHGLPRQLQKAFEQDLGLAAPGILAKAYEDVHQLTPKSKTGSHFQGKVRMEYLEMEEEEGDYTEMALAKLPEMIMQLQDRGYGPADIAFLVRTKKQGALIADYLMAYRNEHPQGGYCFEVVSDESMFLEKAATVRALVAGMQYLADPADEVPFQTMWFYWASLHGKEINHEVFSEKERPKWLQEKVNEFYQREKSLLQLPLVEIVEELVNILGLFTLRIELAYISGFKEAVYDYMANNRADLAGFVTWWEENKEKRTVKIPEGHEAMPILTIHKSKGLQFKVVLMPFLTWKLIDFKQDNIVWSPFRDQDEGLEAVIPLSVNKALSETVFQPVYQEEVTMAFLDTLNMVYVALTRAEEVLWTLSPFKEAKSRSANSLNSLEKNLYQLMEGGELKSDGNPLKEFFDPESKIFDWGNWPVLQEGQRGQSEPVQNEMSWNYRAWGDLLQIKSYAVDFSEAGLAQRYKRSFGVLIHEVLEKSSNKDQALDMLQAFYFEGRLDAEEKAMVTEQLERLFDDPLFSSWFDTSGTLYSEQGILLPGGKQKRPDKIIISDHTATVVDFKTGEEQSKYAQQIKAYMALVAGMVPLEVKGYLCYLESGKILEIN